ncbi:DUF3489 domain-containing protein [Extensimonas vulgaris]|uniref:Uncharacterized protein DUF3489 n=1 Tax=Extensimonas vulgaris TaxID=1031594 RepID=A0A369AJZ5_9BURK|nr:DUF3489 domain-containing protein [Extensimonas vulgaris]RCX08606.1 uncharacterized protein DUF3489 [Extensimonas vulgaris]TWI36221.1 uncharacterized protein DUF3489 [Extensimonas vulgaris]TXD13997.1 DUF3489 domain-containing protein [Extensimonas vulgaris]
MTTTQLTPAQHAILAKAIHTTGGKIEWFPDHIKGGARKKVLDGMFNRALITTDGTDWFVAAEGYDALGLPRPGLNKKAIGQFEAHLDQIIANAEGASAATSDPELEAAVTAAEATWVQEPTQAKPRTRENERSEVSRGEAERVRSTRHNTKQAEVIRLLQRPEGATIGQICAATGWQAHTVRGTLAGVIKRKLGLAIASTKDGKADRVYRIV